MKAISLYQPWASAIAVGLKSIETRSWPAPKSIIGHPLAIHAAKRNTAAELSWWIENVRHNGEFSSAFARRGYREFDDLPRGAIVAIATLAAVISTNDNPKIRGSEAVHLGVPCPLDSDETWGNFSPDRFAWFLADIVPLKTPVPCIGRQGLFDWNPTA